MSFFRWEGERVSGRSSESSPSTNHWFQNLSAEEILGRPRPRLHDLRRVQRHRGTTSCMPGRTFPFNYPEVKFHPPDSILISSSNTCLHPPFSGWLWRSSAVPARPGPLGGARRCEFRPHRLHCGEQTQRLHPHRRLHPLDRGNAHQGLLPALSARSKHKLCR